MCGRGGRTDNCNPEGFVKIELGDKSMAKVLIINGSPRVGGNTSIALSEMINVFEAEGG